MVFFKSALVVCVVLFFDYSQAFKLPDYLPQCKKDLPEAELGKCIVESGNKGLKKLSEGDSSIHILKLDPLQVPQMHIDVDGNLKIDITDAAINGVSDGVINDVKWDFVKQHVNLKFFLPLASLQGTYDIAGRILILPITGNGPCNITYVEGNYDLNWDYTIEEKNSKHYFKIADHSMSYKVKRAHFGLDNLFNGDKRLGDEMTKFLDENWKEVNGEIGVRVGDALGEVLITVLRSFFDRVSMEELFL